MVVDYKVAVAIDKATQTLKTILDTIKSEGKNGTFGNHEVDVDSVTGAGKCVQVYLSQNTGMGTGSSAGSELPEYV